MSKWNKRAQMCEKSEHVTHVFYIKPSQQHLQRKNWD